MNYVEPIRNKEDLNNLLRWAKDTGATENYLVLLVGFTSGLRVSDILNLRVGNVKDSDYTNDTPLLRNEQKILDLLMAGYDDKDILKMTKVQPQSLCKIICDICERWNVPTMQALLVKAFNKKITSLQTY